MERKMVGVSGGVSYYESRVITFVKAVKALVIATESSPCKDYPHQGETTRSNVNDCHRHRVVINFIIIYRYTGFKIVRLVCNSWYHSAVICPPVKLTFNTFSAF